MKKEAAVTRTPIYVDSVEESVARVLIEDAEGEWRGYSLPASLLPAGAGEGSWLELSLTPREPPPGVDARKLRTRLGSRDPGHNFSL